MPLDVPTRALLIRNPKARSAGGDLTALLDRLAAEGFSWDEAQPERADGISEAIRAHAGAIDLVLIAGGDGTVHAALPGLIETGVPLGLIPLGTANDLARSLAFPDDLGEVAEVLFAGREHAIDVASANGKWFVNAAQIGLSAEIHRRLSGERKRRWGAFAYAGTVLDAVREARGFVATITEPGERPRRQTVMQITVANGRTFGGGVTIDERATADDRLLMLQTLPPIGIARLLAVSPDLVRGKAARWEGVELLRGRDFTVRTPERPMTVHADGEPLTRTPVRFELAPAALRVLVPEGAFRAEKEALRAS